MLKTQASKDELEDNRYDRKAWLESSAKEKMYGDQNKHPCLTFIIVQKDHNTRFFIEYSNNRNRSRNGRPPPKYVNMSIGAVIDTTIVHPNNTNFYLNSHNAHQSVNQPSHYHVLLNEIELTTDELQLLTFHLYFADSRSSAAEAVPSVVH
ncbi:unnamed protein product [Rotaria socialis]|uniref:Piwi domain-containing protein n=3 Tax=Rotaria socialis TaxID=392032 RepID=A0A821C8P1_9BILA|nr:unnamed protein product [Rotaria socialis]